MAVGPKPPAKLMEPLVASNLAVLPAAFILTFWAISKAGPPLGPVTHAGEGVAPPISKGENDYVAAPLMPVLAGLFS